MFHLLPLSECIRNSVDALSDADCKHLPLSMLRLQSELLSDHVCHVLLFPESQPNSVPYPTQKQKDRLFSLLIQRLMQLALHLV